MHFQNVVNLPVVEDEADAKRIIDSHLPFVLRGSDIGPCCEKWIPEYLENVIGQEEVKIHVSEFPSLDFLKKNFLYKTLQFGEFLLRATEKEHNEGHYFLSKTEYYYLRSVGKDARKEIADVQRQFPALSKDIVFPRFIPEDRIFSSIFRVASNGLSVWTHYDVMDNVLIQVRGKKRAVLFPPTDALNLYLNGDKSEVLDIDNPDLKKFPKFQNATRHEGFLLPGDILYIPALWFHNMKYVDFGISVNVFWKELGEEFYDKKDTYGNKDLLPAQQAFASVDKCVASLLKLPALYRNFYGLRLMAHIQNKMNI